MGKLKTSLFFGLPPYHVVAPFLSLSLKSDVLVVLFSLFAKDNLYFQAGAGIVADSKPKMELKETINKSGAMLKAIKDTYGKK